MEVANLLLKQQIFCIKYGMDDMRLSDGILDIASTICVKTFKTMMPLAMEVLDQMSKRYEVEKESICVSYGNFL